MEPERRSPGTNHHHLQLVVALALGCVFVVWSEALGGLVHVRGMLDGNRSVVYGTLTAVLGTLLGFALTSFAILLGFANAPQLQRLRNSPGPGWADLWKPYKEATRDLSLATVVGLIALVSDKEKEQSNRVATYALVVAALLSVMRMWSVVRVLYLVTDEVVQHPVVSPEEQARPTISATSPAVPSPDDSDESDAAEDVPEAPPAPGAKPPLAPITEPPQSSPTTSTPKPPRKKKK